MLIFYAILQFLFAASLEILALNDFRLYKQQKKKSCVINTGVMGVVAGLATIFYTDQHIMLIPDVAGLMVGAYLAMTWFPYEE